MLFDLLTGLLDSWSVEPRHLIGTSRVGLDTYWHNRVGLQRPAGAPPPLREDRSLEGRLSLLRQDRSS